MSEVIIPEIFAVLKGRRMSCGRPGSRRSRFPMPSGRRNPERRSARYAGRSASASRPFTAGSGSTWEWGLPNCDGSASSRRRTESSRRSSRIFPWTNICSKRCSQKRSKPGPQAPVGAVSDRRLQDRCAASVPAVADAPFDVLLPKSYPGSTSAVANSTPGPGRGARPLWLQAPPRVAPERGMEGQPQASLSDLHGRGPGCSHQEAQEDRQRCSRGSPWRHTSE